MHMPKPRTALVVEDLFLVGLEAQDALETMGFEVVVLVKGANAALERIAALSLTFALVTVRMEDGPVDLVAKALLAKQVPFVLVCDIGDGSDRPDWLHDMPFLTKPYSRGDLEAVLAELEA